MPKFAKQKNSKENASCLFRTVKKAVTREARGFPQQKEQKRDYKEKFHRLGKT